VNEQPELFEPTRDFPDPDAAQRYTALIGLDEVKERLHKEALIRLDPQRLERWSQQHHGGVIRAVKYFRDRPALFLFGGDVGTGKTQLAETFGDRLATNMNIPVAFRKLTLNARGSGRVGEMTTLISSAFTEVEQHGRSMMRGGRRTGAVILLLDEADALAQSRDLQQMHHEDRAGVNAVIRGVDHIAQESLPVLVVACTNRIEAIDPALRRRAAQTFLFARPIADQRRAVLQAALVGVELASDELEQLVEATGPHAGGSYGMTYSDITQQLVPGAVLEAFPDSALTFERLLARAKSQVPTAPFAN
jgi:AAA+ superfamily predicted ATPase